MLHVSLVAISIKFMRMVILYRALNVSTDSHTLKHTVRTLSNKEAPPAKSLIGGLMISLAFLHAVIFGIVMTLVHFGVSSPDAVRYTMIDSALYTVIIACVGLYVCRIVDSKKYFGYKWNGLSATKAAARIIYWTALPYTMAPFLLVT